MAEERSTTSYRKPSTGASEGVERRFNALVREWKDAYRPSWTVRDAVCNRAYFRIVGMGPAVLPLLLRELEKEPNDWFVALDAIAGRDVAEGEESFEVAVAKWLGWGREQGYIK